MEIIPGHRYTVRRVNTGEQLAAHLRANIARRKAKQIATRIGAPVYLRDEAGHAWGELIWPG